MVWYLPIFIVEGYCQAWFQRLRVSANYCRLTYASPAMYASQGDSLGVFQGSFGWFWSFWAGCSKSSSLVGHYKIGIEATYILRSIAKGFIKEFYKGIT